MDKATSDSRLEQDRVENDPLWMEAAAWFIELRSEHVSSDRIAQWLAWLDQDPRHKKAFDGIASLSRVGSQLNRRWPSESEVAADAYEGKESISAWRERWADPATDRPAESNASEATSSAATRSPHPTHRRSVAMAAALAVGAIALLGWLVGPKLSAVLQGGKRVSLSTDVGEMRALTLADGSLVTAGGHTSLTVILLKHSRRLILDDGEIFLRVAKDPTRPFTVQAGATAVTAVGTAFDVRRVQGESVVAVAEGIVRVSTRAVAGGSTRPVLADQANDGSDLLRAGQQWRLDGSGDAAKVSAVDPDSIAAWREGRLQYLDEPLQLIVTDLARYSSRPILLKDAHVAQMRMTGVVFPDDLDTWLSSLELSLPVRVLHTGDGRIAIEQK
jgi:transmembrane sensor